MSQSRWQEEEGEGEGDEDEDEGKWEGEGEPGVREGEGEGGGEGEIVGGWEVQAWKEKMALPVARRPFFYFQQNIILGHSNEEFHIHFVYSLLVMHAW